MNILKEAKIIIREIEGRATNNELLVGIEEDKETFKKCYGFFLSFDEEEGFEQVEATFKVGTLNEVLKYFLNEGFSVSFEIN